MSEAIVVTDPVLERIDQDVKKFDLNDQKISELYDKYGVLTIKDHTDKEGYEILSKARKDVKAIRVAGDKKRKELNEDANRYVKGVNAYWKTLEGKLETLEETLSEKEEFYLAEKERIKQEELAAKRKIVEERCAKLIELGFAFNGSEYSFDDGVNPVVNINSVQIENAPQERWDSFVATAKVRVDEYQAKLAEELRIQAEEEEKERLRLEEEEKARLQALEEERVKQEAIAEANRKEAERLENIRKEQEKKEEAQKEAEAKLLNEKMNIRIEKLVALGGVVNNGTVVYEGFKNEKITNYTSTLIHTFDDIKESSDADFEVNVALVKEHKNRTAQAREEYAAAIAQEQKELLEKQEKERLQAIEDEKKRVVAAEQARIIGMSDVEHLEAFKKIIIPAASDWLSKIKHVPAQKIVMQSFNALVDTIDTTISQINSTDAKSNS